MKRVTMTEILIVAITVILVVAMAGPTIAQPSASDAKLGDVSHNQPDDQDMGVSYSLTGADASRTAVAWYVDASPWMDLYMVYEGGSSNALLDLSGSGQTVVDSGDVTAATAWDATGGRDGGGAFLYSATGGNRFFLDAGTVMNTSAYTKALWLKRVTASGSTHNIMSSSTASGYHVLYAGGSANKKVTAFHAGGPKIADPDTLVDGVWYHYAVTYQASDGATIVYRNGVQVASGTSPAFTDQTLYIGSFTGGAGNQWEGYLDDVRIYDHVLTPEQILAIYNSSDTIRATETTVGEDWYAEITPASSTAQGTAITSNTLTVATDPPIVGDIPGETVAEDAGFTVIDLNALVADANHADNLISWTYSGETDLSIDITGGLATITAPSDWFGSETITFRATDPDTYYNEDVATFEATSVNDPPTVVSPIPDVNANEDDPPIDNHVDLNSVFTDVEDAGNLNFSVVSNSNATLVSVTIDGTDNLDLSFGAGESGTATIIVLASDQDASTVEDTFVVDVAAGNAAPTVVSPIADLNVNEDALNITNYADLNAVFSDAEDGDHLAFAIVSNTRPDLVSVTIGGLDSAIDLSFTPDSSGTADIVVRATDSESEFVLDTFIVDVAPVNDPPTVVNPIPNVDVNEDAPPIDNHVDLDNVFYDKEGNNLTYGVSSNTNPTLVTVTIDVDNNLDLAFAAGESGTAVVTISATDDGKSASVEDAFVVTVTGVNTPPFVAGPILDVAVNEDNPLIDNYADLNTVFSDDQEGGDLAFQIMSNSNPDLVTVTIGAADSAIDLSFAPDSSGSAVIILRATDSVSEFVEDTFNVDVAPVNDPPVVLDIPNQTVALGNPFATIDLDLFVTDVDNTPSEMNWTWSGNTDLTVMISGSHVATITAPGGWLGTETITFTATDPGPDSDSDDADFTVVPDNPPTVSGVQLNSTSGNDYTDDDLTLSHMLGGGATTAAITWYKNGSPLMDLHMPFEAGPTNALSDLSGNDNAITTGASSTVAPADAWSDLAGLSGSGVYTFGTGANSFYLDAGNVMPTMSSYSKFCWVYKTAEGSSLNIMSGSVWGGSSGGHVLYASGSQGLRLTASHNGVATMAQDPDPLALNTWYHVGVTFDYASGEMILYKDGVPVDTAIVTGSDKDVTDDVLLIGSLTDTPGNQWIGQIDNVRLFNYAASPGQVAEMYVNQCTVICSDETTLADDWSANVTPMSASTMGTPVSSNTVTIVAPCCTMRGDVVENGSIDVADLTYLVSYMFGGGTPPVCLDHADINGDTSIDIGDLTILVSYMFGGGVPPASCP